MGRIRSTELALLVLLCLLLVAATGAGDEPAFPDAKPKDAAPAEAEKPPRDRKAEEDPPRSEQIVYVPPRRGAPRARVGGGMRGARALPEPLVLAPDHLALTVRPSPALFWHVDGQPADGTRVVFTLIAASAVDPVAEIPLPLPTGAGVYPIDLAAHSITLRRDVEYEWSIALVPDPQRRARDAVSVGYITRIEEPKQLEHSADAASYAELGLWYDALQALGESLETDPSNSRLRAERDALLRQAGLDAAVD